MVAFHAPPAAVIQPVTRPGSTAGSRNFFQRHQPSRRRRSAQLTMSLGMAAAAAATLKRIYHWVPKRISSTAPVCSVPCRMNTSASSHG
jgi:hypothetical protein